MNSISTKLIIYPAGNDLLYLTKKTMKRLNITSQQRIQVSFGMHTAVAKVLEKNMNHDSIGISSSLQRKLYLPFPKQIILQKQENGVRIGPIIGILTTDYNGNKFSNSPTGKQHHFSQFFKKMLEPESIYPAYYFVFTPEQVNWRNRTVNGIFYVPGYKGKVWKNIQVPLPDVVYNRVPNRKTENTKPVIQFKEEYQRLGGKLFNQGFFNKWEMHQMLFSDERIEEYFPETYINPRVQTLDHMLKKHPVVYLKPSGGSLGLGIYKVRKENKKYLLSYRSKNVNRVIPFQSLEAVHRTVFKNQLKTGNYLLQQGIHLARYQDRPVDFRVHLHKNRNNEWKVVAIGAKAAGQGSVTTHIRTGGKLLDAKQFIQLKFHSEANTIIQRLNQAAIQIAEVVEEKMRTPIGELGLDMGVDESAQIWLFEVNSKPGRSIFKHPNLKTASTLSTRYLLEYGITLSGF